MTVPQDALGRLLERNRLTRPGHVALIHGDRQWTWAALEAEVNRTANALGGLGVRAGEAVAIQAPNSDLHAIAILALLQLGSPFLPVAPYLSAEAAECRLAQAGCRWLLAAGPALDRARDQGGALGRDVGIVSLDELAAASSAASKLPPGSPLAPDMPAAYIFTTGTTGPPRAAVLDRRGRLANTRSSAISRRYLAGETILGYGSLAFIAGFGGCLLPSLYLGAALVLLDGGDLEGILDAADGHHAGHVFGFQPTLADLAQLPSSAVAGRLRSVRQFQTATPWGVRRSDVEAVQSRLDDLGIRWMWTFGLTEAGSGVCSFAPDDPDRSIDRGVAGWIGRPNVDVEVMVADDDGNALPPGGEGEIRVRSEAIMTSYLNQPDQSGRALEGGWLRTGDLGCFEENGVLRFVDRLKDVIKTGGMNVVPGEVERCLAEHPAVIAAAAVGVPDPRWSEAVVAAVVGTGVGEEDLREFCRARLPRHAVPKRVVFLPALPYTSGNGEKVDRRAVREAVLARLAP
jgi:fatty-acyl-CoA synthase